MRRAVLVVAALAAGCIDLEAEERAAGLKLDDCPGCATANDLQGELMLFVNGKLSDPETSYTRNQRTEDGRLVGPALFLYDPARKGHLVKLGNVELGPDPDEKKGYAVTTFRDIAWSPVHGLWGVSIDQLNDEWKLTRLDVPSLSGADQLLPHQSWALRVADPAYLEEEIVGLTFLGDGLLLGAQGVPGRGSPGGALYRAALPTGYAVEPMYPDDPEFYADRTLTELWTRFPSNLGVAGDLIAGPDGRLYLTARSEHSSAAPLNVNRLWVTPVGAPDLQPLEIELPVARNQDFQGLARVGGILYAIDTNARVFRIDPAQGTAEPHDDLGPLFADPQRSLRIRGATTIEIP